ncbi:hypothetical protein [Campylobacter pinnipediorum]|uniref:Histidine kinase n=1 Tax=Campylobacter pinnipediorum subsp. pinnipediorum TaxID=1660067 RepID=A0AAX0LB38_9BACT|nr:hypothetical protein [Campylobacter pinnipediorum]AQW80948.1 hypothetical protein CPIN17260_0637 [Campylobacter pinnipediorum subsp. pinnipediorum]AQW82563.1 hypothetical protein CPIN17261_0544 [Campylobacter pinnipediorum subsp. pinnipediorum]AQW84248.1 hypothetical protein CPIN17262_0555 [Campylobacter pinnipediorum subsp. pinnipediorum]OPA78851.1 hypothetical protein BFG04_02145 [Campylobacter pinnipediorum subsp. pinnipediorum]
MNNKEFCEKLNISEPTLYNWKKDKPFLYKIVMEYKDKNEDKKENLSKNEILLKYFNNLSELEKDYYISEITARALKKEIDK